jgi:drug/metabolite transporter (DMT)-like permease
MRLEPQSATPLPVPTALADGVDGLQAAHARRTRRGLWLGLVGMLIFAGTIPMTRLAAGSNEAPQLPAIFVAIGRAGVAGLLSMAYLLVTRAPWPRREHWADAHADGVSATCWAGRCCWAWPCAAWTRCTRRSSPA